jgi:hypothetical protein
MNRGLGVVALCAFAACGGGYQARRGITGKTWSEIRSQHFILRTDVDPDVAERRVHDLENEVAALTDVYASLLGAFDAPHDVTEVIVFNACSEVEALHANALGFVTATRDFEARRIMVTCESFRYAGQVFMHELVHVFNRHAFGPLPVWLEEGLAGYLMTVAVENGQVVIGRPFIDTQNLHGHVVANMPTLDKVLGADWQHFHFGNEESAYYLAAKNLVGVMNTRSDADQKHFLQYLRLLAHATDRDAAWRQTFGTVNQEELGEDMRLYHTNAGVRVSRLPHFDPPALSMEGEKLRAGEVHALWVQAQLLRGRMENPAPLLEQIDAAVAEDPSWPDADFWRAVVYRYQAKPDRLKVVELLRAHLALRPSDERALIGVLEAQLGQDDVGEASSGHETEAARLAPVQPDALALAKVAQSSTALNLVGWYFALRRMPDVGLTFARRALAADATCAACMDTLAVLLAENGRFEEAYEDEEAAVGMAGDRAVSPTVQERLGRFRALRDKCRAKPDAPVCVRH